MRVGIFDGKSFSGGGRGEQLGIRRNKDHPRCPAADAPRVDSQGSRKLDSIIAAQTM